MAQKTKRMKHWVLVPVRAVSTPPSCVQVHCACARGHLAFCVWVVPAQCKQKCYVLLQAWDLKRGASIFFPRFLSMYRNRKMLVTHPWPRKWVWRTRVGARGNEVESLNDHVGPGSPPIHILDQQLSEIIFLNLLVCWVLCYSNLHSPVTNTKTKSSYERSRQFSQFVEALVAPKCLTHKQMLHT